jgi:multiple sugar transport system permease protein
MEATAARVEAPAPPERRITERAREERKLAWMLCAPAVIVMLLVTGFPIAYAIYLSLRK